MKINKRQFVGLASIDPRLVEEAKQAWEDYESPVIVISRDPIVQCETIS